MSQQGWIPEPVSRLVKLRNKRSPRGLRGRPGRATLNIAGALEALEPRALLSTVAVGPVQDVKTVDSYPADLTPAGTNLFYVVEDSTNSGQDLVVTNGGGTAVLQDFSSASSSAASAPSQLTAVGDDVLFTTSGGGGTAYDNLLWRSDGTAAGTVQVAIPGVTVSSFETLNELDGNLIVILNAGSATKGIDNQMWAIPGGTGTPEKIEDFAAAYVTPDQVVGNTLYLAVNGGLWATDGTAAGTGAVGGSPSTPLDIVPFNGQAYYFGTSNGQVVFGTVSPSGETQLGTAPIADIVGAAASGSSLYFVGGASSSGKASQLWATDGTQAGTRLVEDFHSISPFGVPLNLTDANGTLFFTLEGADGLEELWKSNGTAAGTSLVKDLGTSATYSGYYGYLTALKAIGGTVYFDATDSTNGVELWASDGTAQGTRLVKDINPGPAGSDPERFVVFDNNLDFAAHDGSSPQVNQLWTSDGTAAGTVAVASFSPGVTGASAENDPGPNDTATLGSELLLPLEDGVEGTELWATNGTAAGTEWLAAVNPRAIAVLGADAYFLGTRPTGALGLWMTDGTAAGTSEVLDLSQYVAPSSYFQAKFLVSSGGKLYFTTGDGNGGVDLWSSGGTASSTAVVNDFTAPSASNASVSVDDLMAFDGKLAFLANDGTDGSQLWISNGTADGTQSVTGAGSGDLATSPTDLTVDGNSLYFVATSSTTSAEGLWLTTGTPAATVELATIPSYTPPGQTTAAAPTPTELTAVGSRVFFVAEYYYSATLSGSATTHDQLWTSDGTVLGTTFLAGPSIDSTFATLGALEPLGNLLLFQAVESPGGATELWKSDGSAAGTSLVADISTTSVPQGIPYYSQGVAAGGVLYFAANDGVHGEELWQSNGTAGGTGLAADINPGSGSSNPLPLAALGGQLMLVASDGVHGAQLMEASIGSAASSPTPTPSPSPSPTSSPAPQIASMPTQTASDGSTFQANLAAYVSDPADPSAPLTYSLGAGAPAGLGINPMTGALTWAVPADQTIGSYPVTLVVTPSGSSGSTATETFVINVVDPGPAPVVSRATVSTRHGLTITLTYSQPMSSSSVLDSGNYLLEIPTRVKVKHQKRPSVRMTPVRLSVNYNAATDQVILKAIGKVSLSKPLELTVVGDGAGGVAKVTGLLLAGSGQPGTDYLATVTSRKVNPSLAVAANTITPHAAARTAAKVAHRPAGPMALAKPAR